MVGRGVKNYFINLKHFFSPLGAFALGIVLGLSVLLPGISLSVRNLAAAVSQATGNVSFDFAALADCIVEAVGRLDWENPSLALDTLMRADWLNDTFNDCIHSLLPEADAYAEQIAGAVAVSIAEILALIIVFAFLSSLGLLGAFLLTRALVKRTIARQAWWKNLLSALFDLLFTALTSAAFFRLGKLWPPSVFISGVVLPLLYGAAALLKAYVLYGRKKTPLKKIVNLKNTWLLLLTNFLVFLLASASVVLAFLLTGGFVGAFLSIPFIFIGLSVILYNAEAYVKQTVEAPPAALAAAVPDARAA